MNDCLKKGGLNVGQARKMVCGKDEWWDCLGHWSGDEPLNLTRCNGCRLLLEFEILRGGS